MLLKCIISILLLGVLSKSAHANNAPVDFKIGIAMVQASWDRSHDELGSAIQVGRAAGKVYFVTAKHVVTREKPILHEADKISINFLRPPGMSLAHVEKIDEELDLAVLAVDDTRAVPTAVIATTGVTSLLIAGQPVVAVGRGSRLWDERLTKLKQVTTGRILLPREAAEGGFSGGPVFDAMRGTLLGMVIGNHGDMLDVEAIPIEAIVKSLADLEIPSSLREGPYQVPVVFIPAGKIELRGQMKSVPAFYIDRDEVTVAQFRQFVQKTGYNYEAISAGCTYSMSDPDALPINCVTWEDATAFARWAGRQLPTEIEWTRAAEQGNRPPYKGRYRRKLLDGPPKLGEEVDDWSVHGVRGMHDSLSEWTADWWNEDSWLLADSKPTPGSERVLRGSSYVDEPNRRRASARSKDLPSAGRQREYYGFRLVGRLREGAEE